MKSFGNRQSLRLQGYDYSQAGAYFVTACVQDRECLFGYIVREKTVLNDAGKMILKWWTELNHKFTIIKTDEFIVMPNHIHGIIVLCNGKIGAALRGRPSTSEFNFKGRPHRGAPTLGIVIDWFKTMTTNAYIRGVKQDDRPTFPRKLWQRNYHEHIIRNESELHRIREYIQDNPKQWATDPENPDKIK